MRRLSLLVVSCVLTLSARGQHLLNRIRYQVYKEDVTHFNINTYETEHLSTNSVNYLMSRVDGGLQVRRASRVASFNAGTPVCQFSGLRYQYHDYDIGTLFETYRAFYKAYLGGTVPPLPGLLNPSAVEVTWLVSCQGTYVLRARWLYGPKRNTPNNINQSYYAYTLFCKPLD